MHFVYLFAKFSSVCDFSRDLVGIGAVGALAEQISFKIVSPSTHGVWQFFIMYCQYENIDFALNRYLLESIIFHSFKFLTMPLFLYDYALEKCFLPICSCNVNCLFNRGKRCGKRVS